MVATGLVGISAAVYLSQLICFIMPVNKHKMFWHGSLLGKEPLEGLNECWKSDSTAKLAQIALNEAKDKCNTFNRFFVSCAEDLRSIHRSSARSFSKWLPQIDRPEKFNLRKITVSEVSKALKDLKPKKATGVDGIPSRLLKDGSDAPASPLSVIFNLTIQQNVIPAEWKKAKVTPLHKSGLKDDPRNYRPISVLPVVSKVLERLIRKQLASFFDDHNLLCKLQSGLEECTQLRRL